MQPECTECSPYKFNNKKLSKILTVFLFESTLLLHPNCTRAKLEQVAIKIDGDF